MKTLKLIAALGLLAGTTAAANAVDSGLICLSPNATGALTITGNGAMYIPAHAVFVNSNHSQSVRGTGNASLEVPYLYSCGGASWSGGAGCTGQFCHMAAPVADPLSSTVFPSTQTMQNLGTLSYSGGTRYVNPGYWAGGASFSGNCTVSMSPGVYVFGSSFSVTSGCTVNGSGVVIVMMGGGLSLSGQSNVNLTPPTSGNFNGIVIAQPSSNSSAMSLSGGSALHIAGAVYAPASALSLSGSGTATTGPQVGDLIVCKTATLNGNGQMRIGGETLNAIQPPHQPLAD